MPETIRQSPDNYDYTEAYRSFGNGRYLANGETFEDVVRRDSAILAEFGVTHEQMGQSLRRLFSTLNTFLPYRAPQINEPIPGVVLNRQVFEMGVEPCPYLSGVHSNIDWHVYTNNMSNGNKAYHPINGPTYVSDMLPEMIEKLGFFEGNVFYGIDPHWAVMIHRLVEKYQPKPYEPVFTNEAWDTVSWFSRSQKEFHDIAMNYSWTEQFLPGVFAFIAPGKIAPHGWDLYSGEPQFEHIFRGGPRHGERDEREVMLWALLIADEDTSIPPDATLAGYPLGKHCNKVKKGLNWARFFPYNPQQVA